MTSVPAAGSHTASLRDRWEQRLDARRWNPGWWGWCIPILIAVFALLLRLEDLGDPHRLIFDETYYAKDAYALLTAGYELEWPEDSDEAFVTGDAQPLDEPNYVVHPPLGKWLIAIGIELFGLDSGLGWRFSSAIAGTLGVLILTLVAQRMFRSVVIGAVAGTLTAVEGHHLVMSRVALLDIFLMLFVLAAFAALLADRFYARRRMVCWAVDQQTRHTAAAGPARTGPVTHRKEPRFARGPLLLWRPWRLLAAVLLGCAVGVKLSGLSFVLVFAVLMLLWDVQARRALGIRHPLREALLKDGIPAFVVHLPVIAFSYIASWSGWIFSSGGWGRNWAAENPAAGILGVVPDWLRSLLNYHISATEFHTDLDSEHLYASHPGTWLLMGRPVSMHYRSLEQGEVYGQNGQTCENQECVSAVLDLANPVIWWSGLIAVVLVLGLWLGRRDWRYGAILAGYVAGYLVWFAFPDRTMFFFYTISFHPFVMLAICAVAAAALRIGTSEVTASGQHRSRRQRQSARQRNYLLLGCFMLLCIAASIFFWPIWTGELIPIESWRLRIWIQSWV